MRPRFGFLFCAALALGACSIVDPNYIAAEGKTIRPATPGNGAIHSVSVLRPSGYRLFVQMDNGGTQTVDIDSDRFMPGQRVQIAGDGRVVAF